MGNHLDVFKNQMIVFFGKSVCARDLFTPDGHLRLFQAKVRLGYPIPDLEMNSPYFLMREFVSYFNVR